MMAITNKERLELMHNLLKNCKVQMMENVMTRDFNKKILADNPKLQDKIVPLVLTIESDIAHTARYIQFIEATIEEIKGRPEDEVYIIISDKKNEKS